MSPYPEQSHFEHICDVGATSTVGASSVEGSGFKVFRFSAIAES